MGTGLLPSPGTGLLLHGPKNDILHYVLWQFVIVNYFSKNRVAQHR